MLVLIAAPESFALTAEDMVRLKQAGIPEEVIIAMVENNYQDAEKVIKLKGAGFKDQTIMAIVKGEARNNQGKERITAETTGKAKILWYLVYQGKPVLQNSLSIENARMSLVDNAALKLEWKEQSGLGLLDELRIKFVKDPFYWTINKDDSLEQGGDGYSYALKSTTSHQGKPDSDGSHYWMLYFQPGDDKLVDSLRSNLQ